MLEGGWGGGLEECWEEWLGGDIERGDCAGDWEEGLRGVIERGFWKGWLRGGFRRVIEKGEDGLIRVIESGYWERILRGWLRVVIKRSDWEDDWEGILRGSLRGVIHSSYWEMRDWEGVVWGISAKGKGLYWRKCNDFTEIWTISTFWTCKIPCLYFPNKSGQYSSYVVTTIEI